MNVARSLVGAAHPSKFESKRLSETLKIQWMRCLSTIMRFFLQNEPNLVFKTHGLIRGECCDLDPLLELWNLLHHEALQ